MNLLKMGVFEDVWDASTDALHDIGAQHLDPKKTLGRRWEKPCPSQRRRGSCGIEVLGTATDVAPLRWLYNGNVSWTLLDIQPLF